ncbi:MAG: hypothetical protein Q7O66_11240 [Dehalococcoidia bacterium]|nr:hypothetical protein [Dehalococcoidia bacterium]
MRRSYRYLAKEARALVILVPLLVLSALAGTGASKTIASGDLSNLAVSPVSPLPNSPPTGVVSDLSNNLWLIGLVVLLVVLVTGVVLWRRRRSS